MTPTPDTSPGDDIESILMGLVVETFRSRDTRDYKRITEAKDRLNRLMLTREREGREKLNRLLNNITPEMINGHTYWRCSIVYKAIAAVDAQLNKEETDGDSK